MNVIEDQDMLGCGAQLRADTLDHAWLEWPGRRQRREQHRPQREDLVDGGRDVDHQHDGIVVAFIERHPRDSRD